MQSLSPTSRYQQALSDGSHQPDNVQLEAVNRLETIFQALTTPARPAPQESGLMARFGNRKLRQQQALQYELEKNKAELEEYREELVSHFARSAELLDNMADDYRQIYQHMAKSSSNLLPGMSPENNPFRNRLAESEAGNDQAPVQMPRDYSEGASGLLRSGAKRD